MSLDLSLQEEENEPLGLLLFHSLDANIAVATPFNHPRIHSEPWMYPIYSSNALIEAAYYGDLHTLQLLIGSGADVNPQACLRHAEWKQRMDSRILLIVTPPAGETKLRNPFEASAL